MVKGGDKLPGDYIAGFVDGEGCFYLTYRKETRYEREGKPTYYRWLPYFAINVRKDDINILYGIKNTLKCGKIYILKKKIISQARYGIQNIDDVYNKVMPFFKQYPLRAKKKYDFELWVEAVGIVYKHKKYKRSYTKEEIKHLIDIRSQMRKYKSYMERGFKHHPE
ncbi:MAG: hypothetical protein HQ530_00715 [Parcubacteria group bacterium]|nr:hypothetical protein [Parcubacteria group bacterium]